MAINYLPQTILVEQLLRLVTETLPKLPEDDLKHRLLSCLKEFEVAMTTSAIYLDEVYKKALSEHVILRHDEAVELLSNAASDIDLNYAANAIEYHVDEYLCLTQNPS
jgi:hypothetical protein